MKIAVTAFFVFVAIACWTPILSWVVLGTEPSAERIIVGTGVGVISAMAAVTARDFL